MNVLRMCVLRVVAVCVFAGLGVGGVSSARAQCTPEWQPLDPNSANVPGVDGIVWATTMWDPDGPGPQTPKRVVGGEFTFARSTLANNIAAYDPATGRWSPLGSGMNYIVSELVVLPSGDLVAAGLFTTAGGQSASRIARWDGSAWWPLGSGMNSGVNALAVLPSGDLVAGGDFTTAGGQSASNIARWNGSAWSPLGEGMFSDPRVISGSSVNALVVLPGGDLVAGGIFTTAGGRGAKSIARWNGAAWSNLDFGVDSLPFVECLAVLLNGDLVAGGNFTAPANSMVRWNGSTWLPMGSGVNSSVRALAVLPNGDLVAGGYFTVAGGQNASYIALWNGSAWSPLASGMNSGVLALDVLPSGDLIAGGAFTTAGAVVAPYLARWSCPPPHCRADFNNVGGVTVQDIFDFLAAYFSGNPSQANFNGDCCLTVQDILDFLAAYFAGCN